MLQVPSSPASVRRTQVEHRIAPGDCPGCGPGRSPKPSGSRHTAGAMVQNGEIATSTPPSGQDWPSILARYSRTDPELLPDAEPSPDPSPSSVHPDETIVRFPPSFDVGMPDDDTATLNKEFRHSWWRRRRMTTLSALNRQQASAATLERFCRCGSTAWVLRDPDEPDRFRLATNRCRNRWCEACGRDRRRVIVANLKSGLEGRDLRLLTMTMAARSDPLEVQLSLLYKNFRTFRHRARIRRYMSGGIYFLELTYNERTLRWHPHLHVIFEGGYLPHKIAKETWHEVTGDSWIVDLRPMNGSNGAASYVAKYATKAINSTVWAHPDRLDEAMQALAGRRTFQTYGDWRALSLSQVPDDPTNWEPVCTLATLIRDARDGDKDSRLILSKLANNVELGPLDLPEPDEDTS